LLLDTAFFPFTRSFLGFVLGRRVGLDRQGVDRSVLEFLGEHLVDQPVALEEWHLFKGGGNDRQGDLGSTVATPSLDDNVQMGNGGELGVIGKAPGADKVFCNCGHDYFDGWMDGWMEDEYV
jgi:hypothetical protein